MITFFIAIAVLIVGYFLYGKLAERIFGIDKNRVMIIPLVNNVNIKITIARASDIEYT